jgi:phosphate-selective porin O and P
MKKIHFMALSLMAVGYTYAQEVPTTVTETTELLPAPAQEAPKAEPKIEVKPAGRILIDAGYFNANEQKDKFVSGVAIPDARAGLGVRYGNWKAKVDIGMPTENSLLRISLSSTDLASTPSCAEVISYINLGCKALPVLLSKYRWKNPKATRLFSTLV